MTEQNKTKPSLKRRLIRGVLFTIAGVGIGYAVSFAYTQIGST